MADEELVYDEPEVDQQPNRQLADTLRKEKRGARADRALNVAGNTAKAGGRTMQAGGLAAQAGGKVAQVGGRGMQSAGKGMQSGGKSMMEAGGELSATGLGAIVGIPLAVLGAGATGLGVGAQGAGKGIEKGGQAVEKGGKVARQTGGKMVKTGDNLKRAKNNARRGGQTAHNLFDRMNPGSRQGSFGGNRDKQGLMNKLHLAPEHQKKDKEDTRSILGALRHKARQNMPAPMAKAEETAMKALSAPVSMATSEALVTAWTNVIDTFGLSLIYINAHVFGRLTAGDEFFCKLGHEWAGKVPAGASGGGNKATKKLLEQVGDKIGIPESMLLIILDTIFLFILLLILVNIILLVMAITSPLAFLGKIFGFMF